MEGSSYWVAGGLLVAFVVAIFGDGSGGWGGGCYDWTDTFILPNPKVVCLPTPINSASLNSL